ncbi:MAG TPA: RagB/SusD family nutrient uptake outer membrane protein [Chitinophagaceae bacterium]|nr:RagB/SusD family nutrient uptake outer membrane protein [Chitinophagaceae bacterium]
MKNMKTFKWIRKAGLGIAVAAAVFGLPGCKKTFLDVEPIGQQQSADFFANAADADKAITSCYGHLNQWFVAGFAHLAITSISSDDAERGSVPGDASFLDEFDNFTFSPTQFIINDYWRGQYNGINLCNQSIDNIPGIDMDPVVKARYIAEAKFIRAYHYFNLVRAFGDVPLLKRVPVTPEEINPVRAPKMEVYDFIESDLTDAAGVLPESYPASDRGRVTRGAALAMLAKVKMYREDWPAVLTLTSQVIAMPYQLATDFNGMFRVAGENNEESIFEVQANTFSSDCGTYSQYSEVQAVRNQFGWGFNIPTSSLESAFEPGDQRKAATILYRGQTTPEGDFITNIAPNPMYNKKVYVPSSVPNACGWGYGREQNRRILRLADIYLIRAEAANEQNDTTEAKIYLNLVRNRAGLPSIDAISKENLRNKIWHERHVELAMEDDRFFDLVRQGNAGTVLRALGKQFVDGKNEVFPIPDNQITLSGGKLTQNPGY